MHSESFVKNESSDHETSGFIDIFKNEKRYNKPTSGQVDGKINESFHSESSEEDLNQDEM